MKQTSAYRGSRSDVDWGGAFGDLPTGLRVPRAPVAQWPPRSAERIQSVERPP